MDRFFLTLCFKSCLRGENDNEYYEVLGFTSKKDATPELIKKNFKKKSLELHPDKLAQRGVEVTAEHKLEFQKVRDAYEVLNDPKRRQLYDELGLTGMQLIENPSQVDYTVILKNYQRNSGDRSFLLLIILLFFAALYLLPVLFSLKTDGTVGRDVPWVALWSPMWVVDLIILLVAFFVLCDDSGDKDDDDKENQSSRDDIDGDNETDENKTPKIPIAVRIQNFASTVLFVLTQIFILIRLDGYTDWSWFIVFIPWFGYDLLALMTALPEAFFTSIPKPDYDSVHANLAEGGEGGEEEIFMTKIAMESNYFDSVMKQHAAQRGVILKAVRLWQAVFFALQLDGIVDWSWGLVLLPIWVYLAVHFVNAIIYKVWSSQKASGLDEQAIMDGTEQDPIAMVRYSQSGTLAASSIWMCLSQIIPLVMAILLVTRLEAATFSTFIILLPIFMVLCCCCCVVCLGVCTLSMVDAESLEEEMRNGNGDENMENDESAKTPFVPTPVDAEDQNPQREMEPSGDPVESLSTNDVKIEEGSTEEKKAQQETRIDTDID